MTFITETFSSSLMQRALLEALIAGSLAGAVGVHVVLRRLSFFTMALTHATFPGLVLAAILGVSLFLGTVAFGLAVVAVIALLGMRRDLDSSTVTGVVLAGGFALGVVLLSAQPGFSKDLSAFLVGSILTVETKDVVTTAVAAVAVLVLIVVPHKELVLSAFDPGAAESLGYRLVLLDLIVLVAIEITVVTSIQSMGTILSVAMIVAPAAAARFWSDHVVTTMITSAAIGAASGFVGLVVSRQLDVAAGPSIALVLGAAFALSLVVAPAHGLVSRTRHASDDGVAASPPTPVAT
jgi:ABC-type Mn2+/Zn2+ transport system permease subunit